MAVTMAVTMAVAGGPSPDNLRRYEIGEVRRKARNLPRGYLQADLDIVHPHGLPPADKLLAEAELIKVASCNMSWMSHQATLFCARLYCTRLTPRAYMQMTSIW